MQQGEIVIYKADEALDFQIEVRVEDETVWLTQAQMAELFDATKQNVSLHINNIFRKGELKARSVVKESLTAAKDGKNYNTKFYNLDVIISVGYRVKSVRGTQFRIWANKILKDYLLKGTSWRAQRGIPNSPGLGVFGAAPQDPNGMPHSRWRSVRHDVVYRYHVNKRSVQTMVADPCHQCSKNRMLKQNKLSFAAMETLKVIKTIHSETITIKGLRSFIGQDVDIIVIPRAKKNSKALSEKKNNAAYPESIFNMPSKR